MIWGSVRPVDMAYVRAKLPAESLLNLFERMPRSEKNHGVITSLKLERQGMDSPDLLTAALLHDVGKIKIFPGMWDRVLVVLVEHAAPNLAARMSQGSPQGLRRGFVLRRCHADWGADLASQAGVSPRTAFLIRSHHTPPGDDRELALLQAVDNH
ncbi:MAG: HD domain-containing protein [Anaerolineae bacterium]|nr:HD domain-containing protein [Anaerolineae bacterium]